MTGLPSSPQAELGPLRLALVGFGSVGQEVARRLLDPEFVLPDGRACRVVAVADSSGWIIDGAGVDLVSTVRTKRSTGSIGGVPADAREVWHTVRPHVVLEVARSDPRTAEPGTSLISSALEAGIDVVTSDKLPIAHHGLDLQQRAFREGSELRHSTTVGGIVPILSALRENLRAADVLRVEGIANGTTQFVLDSLDRGTSFPDAVSEARRQGLTERDPSWDLSGFDSALKGTIIHNLLFEPAITSDQVEREEVDARRVQEATQECDPSHRVAALLDVEPGSVRVRLRVVERGGPWDVREATNVFRVETRHAGTLWFRGAGAGPEATASGVLADLLGLRCVQPSKGPDPSDVSATFVANAARIPPNVVPPTLEG
jgi:homoserine dehydrogenase